MSASPARKLALKVVSRVRAEGSWAHETLTSVLAASPLDSRESALATRLAYGAIEMWGVLDELIDKYLTHPGNVEPRVKDALRVAAYEILFLDTPARAAVHQGVELVRGVTPRAAGLANAVLRRIVEDSASFPFGDPGSDITVLARLTGHPLWLAERLVRDLGWTDAERFMRAAMSPAPLYLAHNPFAGTTQALNDELERAGTEPRPYGPYGCFECQASAAAVSSAVLAEGRAIVVDAAAQTVAKLAPVAPGMRVAEIAAGRGSKTMLLQASALRAGEPVEVIAIDVHEFKTDILRERMRFLGVPCVTPVAADATDPGALWEAVGEPVDIVFLDAPCSGAGALRRHPEKRWRLGPGDIDALASASSAMLRASANLVRPGGFVVYSTCTVFPAENSDVIRGFIASEQGQAFHVVDAGKYVATQLARFVTPEGWFQSIPEVGGPDGHFAAVLRRE